MRTFARLGWAVCAATSWGFFCSKGERPRPRFYEELSKCVGHNAERDLHLWVDAQEFMGVLPPLYSFRVEKFRGANPDGEPTEQTHSALLPHEVFASLGQRSPELFAHLMTGPPGNLDSWWQGAASAAESSSSSWLASARAATGNAELNTACKLSIFRGFRASVDSELLFVHV